MDIGATSALNLYSYQTALKKSGQSATASSASGASSSSSTAQSEAVLQALSSVYSGTSTVSGLFSSTDSLATLAGTSGVLGPLVSGMYSASVASGNTSSTMAGLSASLATVGGLDASSASLLFSGQGTNGSSGYASSAINLTGTLALAAYANKQNGVPATTLGAAASKAAASIDSTQPANVQSAIQAAQSATTTSTLNLLG